MIPSSYTSTDLHFYWASLMYNALWKEAGALPSPKGILVKWYNPLYLQKAGFLCHSPEVVVTSNSSSILIL